MKTTSNFDSYRQQVQKEVDKWSFRDPLASLDPRIVLIGRVEKDRPVWAKICFRAPDSFDGIIRDYSEEFEFVPGNHIVTKHNLFVACLQRFMHELGESIQYEEVLVCDPHARPRVWPWSGFLLRIDAPPL